MYTIVWGRVTVVGLTEVYNSLQRKSPPPLVGVNFESLYLILILPLGTLTRFRRRDEVG